jgi:hypothetical protein
MTARQGQNCHYQLQPLTNVELIAALAKMSGMHTFKVCTACEFWEIFETIISVGLQSIGGLANMKF